ncbi:MAG: hypothetical protein ABFD94_04255 [Armatimonadia bacterium]
MKPWTLREEIAKERFLDMTANGTSAEQAAVEAVDAADILIRTLANTQPVKFNEAYRGQTKGCPACFGSGGKRRSPCQECNGTGKVAA